MRGHCGCAMRVRLTRSRWRSADSTQPHTAHCQPFAPLSLPALSAATMSSNLVAAPTMPSDPDCLDLGALLAPLSREDVELLVVKLLSKHPAEAGWVVAAARKPVDTLEVSNEVKTVTANATSIAGCLADLESHVSRADDFLRSGHVRNAVALLEVMSPPIVSWLLEQGSPDDLDDAEDKEAIQAFTALLENAWQSAMDKALVVLSEPGTAAISVSEKTTLTKSSGLEKAARLRAGKLPYTSLSTAELSHALALLTSLMNKLKATQGAIFSDPIRGINRKIKAATAAGPSAAAATASPAAATAPSAGSKRKADSAEPASDSSSNAAAASSPAAAAESNSSNSSTAANVSDAAEASSTPATPAATAGTAGAGAGAGSAAKKAKTKASAAAK